MSLFLTEQEHADFHAFRHGNSVGEDVFWALRNRALARTASPGLFGEEQEAGWWFVSSEYLTDAAMAYALKKEEPLAIWLRDTVLSIIRRSEGDWVGPWFRNHTCNPPSGHLETAHLSWSVAIALDLAPDVFTETEGDEIRDVLKNRAIPLCQTWLATNHHLANWRCVLNAGALVAAAVLNDSKAMQQAADEFNLCLNIFQADGSYSESLQYSNYAAYTLMLAREAMTRRCPELAKQLSILPYALLPRWQAASLFYRKPLSGWGATPRARSANFNDSAAIFRPSGDLLMHIAARARDAHPVEAGLARWLFDELYADDFTQAPHDNASFGFINDFGFLTPALLPAAAEAISPKDAKLSKTLAFSNGDVLARDDWDGRTVLAVHGGGDPLNGPGHLHGDLNSFILVHNRERLLVDPGHSCYRGLIHGLETASATHNTCTFELQAGDGLGLQEDSHSSRILEQSQSARRSFNPKTLQPGSPAERGAKRLLVESDDEVSVIGSDAAALYGSSIKTFSRFWFLCGAHALFVVDHIVCRTPMRTRWHWLLNNRDGFLELKPVPPDRLVARRGRAGLKLFHLGQARITGPQHAFVHDAYHPEPGQLGEGGSGSGKLCTWQEVEPALERIAIHAMAMDSYGRVAGWHMREEEAGPVLESPDKKVRWQLAIQPGGATMTLNEMGMHRQWTVQNEAEKWSLAKI